MSLAPRQAARRSSSRRIAFGSRLPRGDLGLGVDGVRDQRVALAVHRQVDAGDEPVAVEHREHEVAPAALGLGGVDLEPVAEAEQRLGARAVAEQVVERAQQRRAAA